MKRDLYMLPLLVVVVCCLIAPDTVVTAPAPRPPWTNASNADAAYHEIAQYISRRVLALNGKVPGFGSITRFKNIYVWEHPFKPIVAYHHGVAKWEPVLDAEPPMKKAVYSNGGFTVVIWMVHGDLTWQATRPPVKIGPYTIDAQVAGPQQARIQPIIDQIVGDAANRFNR